tara:strand:+ start:66926 stop:68086 length:1161 start_codon:yes stop_codon:yes gene_type:complete
MYHFYGNIYFDLDCFFHQTNDYYILSSELAENGFVESSAMNQIFAAESFPLLLDKHFSSSPDCESVKKGEAAYLFNFNNALEETNTANLTNEEVMFNEKIVNFWNFLIKSDFEDKKLIVYVEKEVFSNILAMSLKIQYPFLDKKELYKLYQLTVLRFTKYLSGIDRKTSKDNSKYSAISGMDLNSFNKYLDQFSQIKDDILNLNKEKYPFEVKLGHLLDSHNYNDKYLLSELDSLLKNFVESELEGFRRDIFKNLFSLSQSFETLKDIDFLNSKDIVNDIIKHDDRFSFLNLPTMHVYQKELDSDVNKFLEVYNTFNESRGERDSLSNQIVSDYLSKKYSNKAFLYDEIYERKVPFLFESSFIEQKANPYIIKHFYGQLGELNVFK